MKVVSKPGVRFEVHAKPRSRRSRISRVRGDALEVSLAAPPVDGAANAELLRTLAEVLGVAGGRVVLVRGAAAQRKLVEVTGLTEEDLRRRVAEALART
jgi:uncharacterized protein